MLNLRGGAATFRKFLRDGFEHAVEIGTYKGVSAAYMAQFCCHVTTIDLVHGRLEQTEPGWDRQSFWGYLGFDNIDLRLVKDDAEKAAVIRDLDFDFAFIDGDHEGGAPARDFELVRRCGRVLFHDYGGNSGVTAFVDTLPRAQLRISNVFALWTDRG